MKVKCISPRLNHVAFTADEKGVKKAHKVKVGDVFEVASIPASWKGLVAPVESEPAKVTNPASKAQGNPKQRELDQLREEYEEGEGKPAPKNWGVRKLRQVLSKEGES